MKKSSAPPTKPRIKSEPPKFPNITTSNEVVDGKLRFYFSKKIQKNGKRKTESLGIYWIADPTTDTDRKNNSNARKALEKATASINEEKRSKNYFVYSETDNTVALFQMWMNDIAEKGTADGTIRNYKQCLDLMIGFKTGERKERGTRLDYDSFQIDLESITEDYVLRFQNWLLGFLRDNTVARHINTLAIFTKWLYRTKKVDRYVFDFLDRGKRLYPNWDPKVNHTLLEKKISGKGAVG